jgi:16S rRNA processing protein RimM
MTDWDDMVLVGRIARPHGLRGHVVINPETTFVEERFVPGAVLWARSANGDESLTVRDVRVQNGRPVVGFEGFASVEAVERLSGVELRIPEEALQPLEEQQYYEHQLVGCQVRTIRDGEVGVVARVEGGSGGSRLVIEGSRGEIQIPLAVEICVDVDIARKTIRINPPEGLLELNETKASRSAGKST